MPQQRVLIIDDEPDSVYLLRFALERAGFDVSTAGSMRDAMPVAHSSEPDLVLLDLVLQDESGLEICRALRADEMTRNLPIILVTGKLRTEFDTVEGFKAGADDYVMKPFRPAEVVARVTALLDRTRRLREASPLTATPGTAAMPGAAAVQSRMQRLVAREKDWGVLFLDLNGFRVFNEAYGFERGDDLLRALAEIVARAAALDPNSFAGHTGADHFSIVTTPDAMEAMAQFAIDEFAKVLPTFYPPDVIARGALVTRDRRGGEIAHPLLALAIAGVSDEMRSFRNPLEIFAVAADVKKALKNRSGSTYIKDRRNRMESTPK